MPSTGRVFLKLWPNAQISWTDCAILNWRKDGEEKYCSTGNCRSWRQKTGLNNCLSVAVSVSNTLALMPACLTQSLGEPCGTESRVILLTRTSRMGSEHTLLSFFSLQFWYYRYILGFFRMILIQEFMRGSQFPIWHLSCAQLTVRLMIFLNDFSIEVWGLLKTIEQVRKSNYSNLIRPVKARVQLWHHIITHP